MRRTLSLKDFYYYSNLIFNYIVNHKNLVCPENAAILFENGMSCLKDRDFAFAKAFFLYAALLGDSRGKRYYHSVK